MKLLKGFKQLIRI